MHSPCAGDAVGDVLLYQTLKKGRINDRKENEVLNILLKTFQNIALDLFQIQREWSHVSLSRRGTW
jgi:hypothetical protein